jgi:hypothetical protein
MSAMRMYSRIGAFLGWFALVLQLWLMLQRTPVQAWAGSVITFFSFFTILTNLLVALVFTAVGFNPGGAWADFVRRPAVQASTAAFITAVGVTYWLLLKHLWNPQGAQWVADMLLHTWLPMIYVVYWIWLAPKRGLRWTDAVVWLGYPAVYLVYVLARGAIIGVYPYPFVDVNALGYAKVFAYAGMLMVLFLGLSLVVVATGRLLARKEKG